MQYRIVPIKRWMPIRYKFFRRATIGYRYYLVNGPYAELVRETFFTYDTNDD